MIGNDIIDLHLASKESPWNRPRYLDKIFTEEEQSYIYAASNNQLAASLLWSRKESAYKIISRMQKRRFYSPKKLKNIQLENMDQSSTRNYDGLVSFEEYTIQTISTVTKDFIHTLAKLQNAVESMSSDSFTFKQLSYKTQQKDTRTHLKSSYAKTAKVLSAELMIKKDKESIPHLYYQNEKLPVIISISHHGLYGGYAYCENPF